jgi:hypothetical protein
LVPIFQQYLQKWNKIFSFNWGVRYKKRKWYLYSGNW